MTIKPKVVFAPGCFDNFTGTQEELDAMIAEINEMVETGEFFDHSINLEDMTDVEREELFDGLEVNIRDIQPSPRTLN